MSYEQIIKDLQQKKYHPVYVLAGEESYFIDQISDYIEKNILSEEEKSFNFSVFYGIESDFTDVVAAAKRFPMMAEYNLVIIKEAQLMKSLDKLEAYLLNPTPSTILVICHRGKALDERTKFAKTAQKHVYFKSAKLKEADLINFTVKYLNSKKCKITPKAAQMIYGNIGDDLEKIINEIDKMLINFPNGLEVTEKEVEEFIGISRSFNVFELQKAIGVRNISKATEIAYRMSKDEKNNPMPAVTASLFGYFTKILHLQYCQSKSIPNAAKMIGVNPYFVKEYEVASKNYSPQKLLKIVHHLKDYDLRSKGVNSNTQNAELMKELVYKILN